MAEVPFLITIDTEGDDLWGRPLHITTRNAGYLPRFQALCERHGFKPVYLTNHEMACSEAFVAFGRDVAARDAGEIGMHLHAWNSPPIVAITEDDFLHQPYLIEYPDALMREKIKRLTGLLQERFDREIVSHRAGRWAFDGRYAAMLSQAGYLVDCSVTPGVDWRGNPGHPQGDGGSDYSRFPLEPYFLDPADISRPAAEGLLEVPMTIVRGALPERAAWAYRLPLLRRVANRVSPAATWLSPLQPALRAPFEHNVELMMQAARAALERGAPHLEFMLHSSELMPGGSPSFADASDIDRLYDALEALFGMLAPRCRGMTLKEFRSFHLRRGRSRGAGGTVAAAAMPAGTHAWSALGAARPATARSGTRRRRPRATAPTS
jgi:hypothetical protein